MKRLDLIGKRFGRLVVIGFVEVSKSGHSKWLCRCDCGNEVVVYGDNLIKGHTISCGCYGKEHPNRKTHGLYRSRLYQVYMGMIGRCYNPNYTRFEHWGGRGIKVCDEWKNDRTKFFEWALSHGYADNLQIDRIDNDGNYCPENCRFVTAKDNSNNRSACIKLTDGVRVFRSARECCEVYGYAKTSLCRWVKLGTLEKHTNLKIVE